MQARSKGLALLACFPRMGLGLSREAKSQPVKLKRSLMSSFLSPEAAYVDMRKAPMLFETFLREEWLAPSLLEVVASAERGERHPLLKKETDGVYSLDVFTEKFCQTFLEEVDNYFATGLPVRRPNSMNNYGLIVNEIGLRPALTDFQQKVLRPLAALLFPEIGQSFGAHHSFMVQYRPNEDLGLDMHTDDSDVTFNVCLGDEFEASGLTFCGGVGKSDHRQFSYQYNHVPGRAVLHLGTRRHGADDIYTGTRRNLIVWSHNLEYRASDAYVKRMYNYEKEQGPPDVRCLSYTHDRDYNAYKNYPPGVTKDNAQRAWCPPPMGCYDQMDTVLKTSNQRGPLLQKKIQQADSSEDDTKK